MFSPNFSLFFLKEARVRMNYQTDTSKKHHGQDSILRIKTDFPLMVNATW